MVGVTACVLGDTLKEEDEGWSKKKKKSGGTQVYKLDEFDLEMIWRSEYSRMLGHSNLISCSGWIWRRRRHGMKWV